MVLVQSELVTSDYINADQKSRAKGQRLHFQFNTELLMYIYGWPNNFLNGQILAEVFGHMS